MAELNARRTALINKVWNRTTVDTLQGVDEDTPPATIDVQPLPPGVTVRRHKINMPTSGGALIPGGPAIVQGLADHFIPGDGWQKLVILNPGHTCNYTSFPYQDSDTVIELLNAEYAVLATYMPLLTTLQCGGSHNDLFDPTKNLRHARCGQLAQFKMRIPHALIDSGQIALELRVRQISLCLFCKNQPPI